MSLWQWCLIDRSVVRPVPMDANNLTMQEIADMAAFDLRSISAYQEIKYRVGDTAKSVLGTLRHSGISLRGDSAHIRKGWRSR